MTNLQYIHVEITYIHTYIHIYAVMLTCLMVLAWSASRRPFTSLAELLCDNLREHLQSLPADGGHPAQHGRGLRGAALHHDPEGEDAGAQQVQEHDL